MRSCILALVASLTTTSVVSQMRTEPTVEGVVAGRLTRVTEAEMHTNAAEMTVEVAGRPYRFAYWSPSEILPKLEANLNQRVIIEFQQGALSPENEALSENLYGTMGVIVNVRARGLPRPACVRPADLEKAGVGAEEIRGVTLVSAEKRTEPKRRRPVLYLGFNTPEGAYRQLRIFDVELYPCFVQLTESGRPVDLSLTPSTIEGLSRVTGIVVP